ncbi:peptide ABC transporter permease, partial [Escherichia coli]
RVDFRLAVAGPTGLYTLDAALAGDLPLLGNVLFHLLVPATALATIPLAMIARLTRAALLEALSQDYIRTARA